MPCNLFMGGDVVTFSRGMVYHHYSVSLFSAKCFLFSTPNVIPKYMLIVAPFEAELSTHHIGRGVNLLIIRTAQYAVKLELIKNDSGYSNLVTKNFTFPEKPIRTLVLWLCWWNNILFSERGFSCETCILLKCLNLRWPLKKHNMNWHTGNKHWKYECIINLNYMHYAVRASLLMLDQGQKYQYKLHIVKLHKNNWGNKIIYNNHNVATYNMLIINSQNYLVLISNPWLIVKHLLIYWMSLLVLQPLLSILRTNHSRHDTPALFSRPTPNTVGFFHEPPLNHVSNLRPPSLSFTDPL